MECMNCYAMLHYATVRWIHGSLTYVIATTTIDRKDKWLSVEISTLK